MYRGRSGGAECHQSHQECHHQKEASAVDILVTMGSWLASRLVPKGPA